MTENGNGSKREPIGERLARIETKLDDVIEDTRTRLNRGEQRMDEHAKHITSLRLSRSWLVGAIAVVSAGITTMWHWLKEGT